jgi:superfamily II DNA or RNA helicase
MEKIIPDAVQIAGKDSDDRKVQVLEDFAAGKIRVLVTKSVLTGFGLNWQHCSHQTFFPSHSFEQWYQSVRRSWRFGQKNPVTIDVVTSEGESEVLANLNRKQVAADEMFSELVSEMKNSLNITATPYGGAVQEIPSWM